VKVLVVSDNQGRIISISRPGDVGDAPSGIGAAGVVPMPGQRIDHVELPKEFESRPLLECHWGLRVEVKDGYVRLVPAKQFREPYHGD
jgi:hypothetical protein